MIASESSFFVSVPSACEIEASAWGRGSVHRAGAGYIHPITGLAEIMSICVINAELAAGLYRRRLAGRASFHRRSVIKRVVLGAIRARRHRSGHLLIDRPSPMSPSAQLDTASAPCLAVSHSSSRGSLPSLGSFHTPLRLILTSRPAFACCFMPARPVDVAHRCLGGFL